MPGKYLSIASTNVLEDIQKCRTTESEVNRLVSLLHKPVSPEDAEDALMIIEQIPFCLPATDEAVQPLVDELTNIMLEAAPMFRKGTASRFTVNAGSETIQAALIIGGAILLAKLLR